MGHGARSHGDPLNRTLQLRRIRIEFLIPFWKDDRAAQMVEFAVTLPLMVVFVVGIFDFSGAFTLRQKLTNIARDAARAAAADPGGDIVAPSTLLPPASISDGYQLIVNYFQQNKIDTCGISTGSALVGPTLTNWTFTGTSNCPPGGLKIDINRGYYFPQNSTVLPSVTCGGQTPVTGQVTIIATCVSIQYAYAWRFGRVASLLGSTTTLPTVISATAVAMNEN